MSYLQHALRRGLHGRLRAQPAGEFLPVQRILRHAPERKSLVQAHAFGELAQDGDIGRREILGGCLRDSRQFLGAGERGPLGHGW